MRIRSTARLACSTLQGKTAGKKAVSRSSKAGLQFPVGRIARYLKKVRAEPCLLGYHLKSC